MSNYKFASDYIGYPPIEGAPLAAPATGAFPAITPGSLYVAEDKVFGPGEFVFARANGAIRQFGLCVLTPVWDSTGLTFTMNMTEAPNTTLLGRPLYVAQSTGAMSSGQYGWFMTSGITPINGTAAVTADTAIGIVAAGQVGALAAGKQLMNARSITSAAQTVAKAGCTGLNGGTVINCPDVDGLFVGGYLSGTGVGASAIITAIDPINMRITASVANSAAIAGTVTQTANNATIYYNMVQMNRLGAQGPIT